MEDSILGGKPLKSNSLELEFKHTFEDYPKFLFQGDVIDLVIFYGSSLNEMQFVPQLRFDPANLADPLFSVGLGAFLATEFGGPLRKHAKHFPEAFLDLNVKYDVPEDQEISAASIESGILDYTKVKGDFRAHNMLLVGSGNVNPLTALVQKAYWGKLPIHFDEATSKAKIVSEISGTTYSREMGKYALLMIVPSPWNQDKTAILCVGTDRWGT